MMTLVEIAKVISKIMADLFGFDPKDLDFGVGASTEEVANFADEVGNATKNIDKMKKTMFGVRSFDKIINISNPSDKNSGANGGLGISPELWNMANKAMDEYNSKLTNVTMKATKIRDKIMEWLGFSKQIDEKTGEVSFKFDHITSGTVLGSLAVGGAIYNGIHKIYKILSKFGLIKMPNFSGLTKVFSSTGGSSLLSSLSTALPIVLIVAGEIQAILTDEDLQEQIKRLGDNFKKLKEKLQPLVDKILPKLEDLFKKVKKAFKETMGQEWDKFVHLLGTISELFLNSLNTGIEIFIDLIDGNFGKAVDDLANGINEMLIAITDFVVDITNKIGGLPNIVKTLTGGVEGHIFDEFKQKIKKNIEDKLNSLDFKQVGLNILNSIINGMLGGIPKAVEKFYTKFKKSIEENGANVTIKNTSKKAGLSSLGIFGALFKANGGVYSGGQWHNIQRYDGGGMPQTGQLFWARENGLPEMVGQIGGHTAVMNNDQIVGSVASGVYRATLAANSQSQNSGNSVINIYLDKNKKLATYTLNELQAMAKSNGKAIEIS